MKLLSLEKKAPGRLYFGLPKLNGGLKKDGNKLFSMVYSDRTKGNCFKLKEGRFRPDTRKKFFTVIVVTHLNR